MEPVAVGLVGAGPWAETVHGPMLAAGPHTRLAGVWARRPRAAARLGGTGLRAHRRPVRQLRGRRVLVPPGVQAELAVLAARAGKALLLEKPLAADLDGAERVAEAVGEGASHRRWC